MAGLADHAHPQHRGHRRRHPAQEELRREHLCRPQALHGHHPDAHRRGPRQRGLQRRQPRARPRDRPADPRGAGARALRGKSIFEGERIWEALFALTHPSRDKKTLLEAIACVDSALWDLVGKALGQSVSALLGGYRRRLPIITIGGYYMDGKTLGDIGREMEAYRRAGMAGCKFKVGGLAPEADAERVEAARRAAGPDFVLAVDANRGWSVGGRRPLRPPGRAARHPLVRGALPLARRRRDDGARATGDADPDHRGPERDHEPRACGGSSTRAPSTSSTSTPRRAAASPSGAARPRSAAPRASRWRITRSRRSPSTCWPRSPTAPTSSASPIPSAIPVWQAMWANRPAIMDGMIEVPPDPGFGLMLDEAMVQALPRRLTGGDQVHLRRYGALGACQLSLAGTVARTSPASSGVRRPYGGRRRQSVSGPRGRWSASPRLGRREQWLMMLEPTAAGSSSRSTDRRACTSE